MLLLYQKIVYEANHFWKIFFYFSSVIFLNVKNIKQILALYTIIYLNIMQVAIITINFQDLIINFSLELYVIIFTPLSMVIYKNNLLDL